MAMLQFPLDKQVKERLPTVILSQLAKAQVLEQTPIAMLLQPVKF
jgi:hypothetical protein